MKRRKVLLLLGGATVTWPFAARAEPSARRIGALFVGNADIDPFRSVLSEELGKAGYIEGRNLAFEFRSAEGKLDLLPKLATELVASKVDVIVALYTPCALAAQQATREIPIVAVSGDPVGTGLVQSLAHPGGNVTGVSLMAAELAGKCVELFRDILPSLRRVAVLANAADPFFSNAFLQQIDVAGRATGIEIAPVIMIRGSDEIDAAFAAMKDKQADAVLVQASLSLKAAADLALKHKLPAATVPRSFAELGGLLSYGADGPDSFRHGASFVVKILQGAVPKDMPIEQPTKFELVLNLKTAKTLGIEIPGWLLSRADEVIE